MDIEPSILERTLINGELNIPLLQILTTVHVVEISLTTGNMTITEIYITHVAGMNMSLTIISCLLLTTIRMMCVLILKMMQAEHETKKGIM